MTVKSILAATTPMLAGAFSANAIATSGASEATGDAAESISTPPVVPQKRMSALRNIWASGGGTQRRFARERARREEQKHIPMDVTPTRQMKRAAYRAALKIQRSSRKITAMKVGVQGGAAVTT